MSVRRFTVALAALAVLIGIVASSVFAQSEMTTPKVKVSALDTLKFTLSTKRAHHGKVTFVVTNKGTIKHDFWIAGKKTVLLGHNQTKTLTVTIKTGKNPYKCTVPGHAAAGMKGTFIGT